MEGGCSYYINLIESPSGPYFTFFDRSGSFIVAGSDDGKFFIWDRESTNIVKILTGDDSIVNCLQGHPSACLLATSGIESTVKLWSPQPEASYEIGY